jgi:excinuclease ABC subunit C
MIALTRTMEFVHTQTEVEALLLESNLIKKLQPRFNVLLKDDKSFPSIFVPSAHDFPMIRKHRGARKEKGDYFGPFASAGDVSRTINILQRVFMLRNCTDSYFAQRKRPCLQYHIKRCTAPCVGFVTKAEYAVQINQAKDFLEGRSRAVQEEFAKEMKQASENMEYEKAAAYRDRIRALTAIQSKQDVNVRHFKNTDVLAIAQKQGQACVQVFFFRGGQNYGNRSFFPVHTEDQGAAEILGAFIAQFYEDKPAPPEILVSHAVAEKELIEEALSSRNDHRVRINTPQKGEKGKAIEFVARNAANALARHLIAREADADIAQRLVELLGLDDMPRRIEVFDNSHISGTNMVGAMIVAGPDGFQKNAYRKFNIREASESDDYGMMREVIFRRFSRALKEDPDMSGSHWPDLILIDGGKGQLGAVYEVLEDLGLAGAFAVLAIAKGEDRNAGREQFFMKDRPSFQLKEQDPALHYLQRLRDEAHRFAIGAHRTKRQAGIVASPLDEIQGIGAARKKALLHHFGSGKAVAGASVSDLLKVAGISKDMAQRIYDHFHE